MWRGGSKRWRHALHCTALALSVSLGGLTAAEDPYDTWSHGRPQDALSALHTTATATNRWDAWYDLGLAAFAAERDGEAVVWMVQAHRLAPERPEPRQALHVAKVALPVGWLDHLGPLALPGLGWLGLSLIVLGGVFLGYGLSQRRGWCIALGVLLLAAALPGHLAYDLDRARMLVATVRASQLYDSAGRPVVELPAGTVLEQESSQPWANRLLVHDQRGNRGYVPVIDTAATP